MLSLSLLCVNKVLQRIFTSLMPNPSLICIGWGKTPMTVGHNVHGRRFAPSQKAFCPSYGAKRLLNWETKINNSCNALYNSIVVLTYFKRTKWALNKYSRLSYLSLSAKLKWASFLKVGVLPHLTLHVSISAYYIVITSYASSAKSVVISHMTPTSSTNISHVWF